MAQNPALHFDWQEGFQTYTPNGTWPAGPVVTLEMQEHLLARRMYAYVEPDCTYATSGLVWKVEFLRDGVVVGTINRKNISAGTDYTAPHFRSDPFWNTNGTPAPGQLALQVRPNGITGDFSTTYLGLSPMEFTAAADIARISLVSGDATQNALFIYLGVLSTLPRRH